MAEITPEQVDPVRSEQHQAPNGTPSAMLTSNGVEHIAKLARIKLTKEEKTKLTSEMGSILAYISKLNEVNTDGPPGGEASVEPTAQVTGLENVLRKDEINDWWDGNPHDLVEAAPEHQGNYVKVKAVLAK